MPVRTAALIVAAGRGERAGGALPKQYRVVRGKPVLRHAVAHVRSHSAIGPIFVAIAAGEDERARAAVGDFANVTFVTGGASRQDSVALGLEAIAGSGGCDRVLIHDAARPFLPRAVIERLLAALDAQDGAIPVLPVVDSLASGGEVMTGRVDRAGLWRVQTPQAFRFDSILAAHRAWDGSPDATDDAEVARAAGLSVALVAGDEALAKLTHPSDFPAMANDARPPFRTGSGTDVHRLVTGRELWLGGVLVPHSHGLLGHSDADVVLHALTDAILGAAAQGDIGQHFPPSDPQWRDARSDRFLAHANGLAAEAGYALGNADITIICEAPKIGPYREAMRGRIAEILGVGRDRIGIKATTTERLGFTGRGEAIAAQASVLMVRM